VLVTAPEWFDLELDYPAHVVHAGPLGIRTRRAPPRPGPPHVLLSFSTTVVEGQLSAIQRVCDAIDGIGTRATLTLGPAVDRRRLRLPDGLEVDEWANHDALLADCTAVITHGGLGTPLRALAHGVPLLLLPLGRDQAFNAARVSELGAGIQLSPDAEPAAIWSALDRLLHDPSYSTSAARLATRIATDEPDRRATEALERCART
jgi:UDP:flavonoid glycosyltransferase YjiC (YdhE family)